MSYVCNLSKCCFFLPNPFNLITRSPITTFYFDSLNITLIRSDAALRSGNRFSKLSRGCRRWRMNVLMIATKSESQGSSTFKGMTLSSAQVKRPAPVLPPAPLQGLALLYRVSVAEGLRGWFFLVPRPRRTEFRALSPRCNPALNIQKRDRPAKSAEELVRDLRRRCRLNDGRAFHMLIGIRHFLMAPT